LVHVTRAVLVLAVLAAASAPSLASPELAQKHACLACHAADKKMIGPSYQEVAKKYAGQADAQAKLMASIKAGGAGKWGPVPMPAQPHVPEADLKALAGWIAAQAK
jgi:cytochrome c